jgi:hypothetical protein
MDSLNTVVSDGRKRNAGCPASRLLLKALKKAILIISWEFKTPDDLLLDGEDCLAIRHSWEKNVVKKLECFFRRERRQHRLTSVLKSCKRIFDIPCYSCDAVATAEAKEKWVNSVCKDIPTDLLPSAKHLDELRLAVRENLCGWGRKLKECRRDDNAPYLGEYVPDQQGCYERTTKRGGTLSVSDLETGRNPVNRLRMGTAKTKGKIRVVTMQTARAKRVLTPVHNALYSHLTDFGWCVRGDVRKGDFEVVANDRREGESLISGDYMAATDNIFLESVDVVVDEISKSKELTEEEREVLVDSFRNPEFKMSSCAVGEHRPIKRGSMMGNLVSFPLLCLINKSCFDIACDIRDPGDRSRKGRFNGDDCMFAGDRSFMTTWRAVTGRYGLIVNEEKTGFSRRWLELNSQPYDCLKRSLVSKPVISFLLPSSSQVSGLLTSILQGLKSFRRSVTKRVLGLMKFEIAARGVVKDLSSLTPYWREVLVRFRWFRAAAIFGGAPILKVGTDRSHPVSVGPPPYPRYLDMVTRLCARAQREHVQGWKGVVIDKAASQKVDKCAYKSLYMRKMPQRIALRKFVWIGYEWAFVWPTSVLRVVEHSFPCVLMSRRDCIRTKWLTDHPFLTRRARVGEVRTVRAKFYPPPPSIFEVGGSNAGYRLLEPCSWELSRM